jgi:hypothetical protein
MTMGTFTLAVNALDWLTGVPTGSWSSMGAGLGWTYALPGWVWAAIVLGSVAVSWASYRKLVGKAPVRVALAGVRGLIILLVAILLAGPVLVIPRERIEPDRVIFLVDQSESMRVKDQAMVSHAGAATAPATAPAATLQTMPLMTRYEAVVERIKADVDKLPGESDTRRVAWLGFDDNAYALARPTAGKPGEAMRLEWPVNPTGQDTRLRHAIEEAIAQAGDQPVAAVVVISDGRSSEPVTGDLARRLSARGVPVFSVPLGAPGGTFDIAVASVDFPERAFVKDIVPVNVELEATGDAVIDYTRIKARLVDQATGKVLDEAAATQTGGKGSVRLVGTGLTPGPVRWKVEVVCDIAGKKETVLDNNTQDLSPTLVDRPIGVLYIEGYPRWEYRYLKTLLTREGTFTSSMFLLSADKDFAQEGTRPITRLPETAKELDPYDLVIIGDVDPTYFSPEQIKLLRDHVAVRGAGLLWIGGDQYTPRAYESTGLANLLPMRRPGQVGRTRSDVGSLTMRPTAQAAVLGVMRIAAKPDPKQTIAGWPGTLPPFMYAQDVGPLKPGAESLSVLMPSREGSAEAAVPGVIRSRYGAGQVVYTVTDETWRWRLGVGELYFEPYWVQLIRMLARSRLLEGAGRATLTVAGRRAVIDVPMSVEMVISDQTLIDRNIQSVQVGVFEAGRPGGTPVETLRLGRVSRPENAGPVEYRAVWRPGTMGERVLRVIEPGLEDLNIQRPVLVASKPGELRNPLPDHANLELLSRQTAGQVVELDRLETIKTLIPDRARRTPDDIKLPVWNSGLALFLVVFLLTLEWIGRRLIRLV